MKKADIVMTSSVKNRAVHDMQMRMLDSFLANTPKECRLLIVENNSSPDLHVPFRDAVQNSGNSWLYYAGDFQLNKIYNWGADKTHNEIVLYANSDLIFHPQWYENLTGWFDRIPNIFCIAPFTKWHENAGIGAYRTDTTIEDRFLESVHMPGWIYCFERKTGFKWDERFTFHYCDNDFVLHCDELKHNNPEIHTGIAYNSRVDHIGGGTHSLSPFECRTAEGRDKMLAKWGDTCTAKRWGFA